MKKVLKITGILVGLLILFIFILFVPLPFGKQEQIEFDKAIPSYKMPLAQAIPSYKALIEKYPANRLYIELLESLAIPSHDTHKVEFCENAQITRINGGIAAICAYELAYAMRYEEAKNIINNYEKEQTAKTQSQMFVNPFERWRAEIKLTVMFWLLQNENPQDIARSHDIALFNIYYQQEDYDKAMEYAVKLQDFDKIGDTYLKKNDIEKAQEYYNKIPAAKPGDEYKPLVRQAKIAFAKGDYASAKKLFIEANEITKGSNCHVEHLPAREGLAEIALAENDTKTALEYYHRILQKKPYDLKLKKKVEKLEGMTKQ